MKTFVRKSSLVILMVLVFVQGFAQIKNALRLKLSSGSYSDETIVRFAEDATDDFDSNWDAYKLRNGGNTPDFYTSLNGISYSINSLHEPYMEKSVPLYVDVAFSGTYSITTEILGPFDSTVSIKLIDNFLHHEEELNQFTSYSFEHTKGSSPERFMLVFTGNSNPSAFLTSTVYDMDKYVEIRSLENKLEVSFQYIQGKVTFELYRVGGRERVSKEIEVTHSGFIWECRVESGLYIIEMVSKTHACRKKILVHE